MADAEAQALVKAADKDGNQGIDFGEFAQLWQALHGEDEVGSRDFIRITQQMKLTWDTPASLSLKAPSQSIKLVSLSGKN